jgi:TctA family transporter
MSDNTAVRAAKLDKIFGTPVCAVLLAIFCNVLWGSAFPFIKLGYRLFSIDSGNTASIFCFAGAYSVNNSYFDLSVALVFGVMAWFMRKLELPAVPVLLGMVLGNMTETNFRRALLISDGSPRIFVSSVYCWIFIALIVVVILGILRGKMKEAKNTKAEQ